MQKQRDLFEELRELLLCCYISDMRNEPFRSAAKETLAGMQLRDYPLRALSDAAEYLYGVNLKFDDYAQAEEFFRGYVRRVMQ